MRATVLGEAIAAQALASAFLTGGGETGALIRAHDWAATPLGAPAVWPPALRTAVSLLLTSAGPVYVAWGRDLTSLYNDGYLPIVGHKHPGIGLPFRALWAEIWDQFRPIVERVMAGEAQHFVDLPIALAGRPGVPEGFFTFSYTPLVGEDGSIAGFYCAATETTDRVLAERRRAFLYALDDQLRDVDGPRAIMDAAVAALGRHLGAERVGYSEARADDETVDFRSCYVDGVAPLLGAVHLDDFGPASIARQRRGETNAVGDVDADPDQNSETWRALDTRAFVSVPLVRDGRFGASLYVNRRAPHEWTDDEVRLIEEVASRTWSAVERARAETALRESERELRFALDAGRFGAWRLDLVSGVLITSSICRSNFGRDPAVSFSYAELRDAVHPDDRQRMTAAVETSVATGALYDIEYRIVTPTGETRWVQIRARPVRGPGNAVVEMAGVSIDITDRRRADGTLRASEERLRLAVDNADVGFWDVDIVNDRLIWPARTKAMFGIAADTPVTLQDFYGGLHPDDLAATSEAYAATADPARRALYDVDYRTIGKTDGVVRWIAAKGRGVFDDAGACIRVAGTVVEITARKQAEAALHDLNATLETRVTEAVAAREAAQEALRQSQKMEAIGHLTGGVAHDFNNLLTPIVGSLDLLMRKGVGGEREQRLIAGAAQAADRARTLVQRLLAFARRQPLQPVAVDVARLVTGMGELVASTTGPQIKVVVEAAHDLPPAQADPNQLEMALLNLAVNARDAMPDGGTLRITATAETAGAAHRAGLAPGEYVRLSVADTGSGMDEATLARAVEPFFSTKGIGRGTGLGLSMVDGLASQLGGALTIQSRAGLGSNIELWLPRSTGVPSVAGVVGDTAPARTTRGTVLLVEDEELVRLSTADMLADIGFEVAEAASAEEALRAIDGGAPFDMLMTDHLMPGMTGTELARHVLRARPGTPVLLVSGYTEGADVDPDLPRLTKPFRRDELASIITSIAPLG